MTRPNRLRILHVPHAYEPVRGGAELVCKRVSEELVRAGHDVRVVTANVSSVESYYRFGIRGIAADRASVNGVDVVRLPFVGPLYEHGGNCVLRIPSSRIQGYLGSRLISLIQHRFTLALERAIREFRPHVVVALPHEITNVRAVLDIRRRMPFPTVLMPLLHEHDPSWSRERIRQMLAPADAVVALTVHEADRLREAYVADPGLVFFGGVGVDLPPSGDAQREPSVLFLGRKTLSKSIDRLIDAMRDVWRVQTNARLILAGARAPDTPVIEAAIAALPPGQRALVQSLDGVTHDEKLRLLRSSACLVLPSLAESFGLVLLEAWSCATPVVTYDLPVFRCTIDHERDGLLVDPDAPGGLGEAILRLLQHPARTREMGANGLDKVQREYRWSTAAERYLCAYEHAISVHERRTREPLHSY